DLVRYLEDGNIEYIGRIDDQVKIRGFRIELGEIEQQLLNIEVIKESVVLAKEDEHGNKSLVAYITTEDNKELESGSIKSTLSQHLPDYMIPVAYKTIESMPLTPNGKVDKKALAKLEVEIQSSKEYVAPRNETEEKLAKIFQEVLNVERVGIYDNFFELGGHSLLTIEMINRLNKIGLTLSIQDVFSAPRLVDMTIKLQEYSQVKLDVPENLIPDNCNYITPDMLPLLTISQDEIDKVTKVCQGGVENIQDMYPLSSLQKGMLFHHRLNTEFDTYILPTLLVFNKIDDFNSIIDALQYTIDRHDVLRTSIHYEGLENPIQVVYKTIKLKAQEIKISTQDNIKEKMLERMELKNLYMPLTVAPLLRIEYAQDRGTNQYYVLFKFHHIISDHISLEIVMKEISAYLTKQTEYLPEPLPYRNFIHYTQHKFDQKKAELFFLEKLSDVDEPTLPFGLLDTHGDGDNISEDRCRVSLDLSQKIRSVCLDLNVTPAAFFHVAFSVVLGQCSNKDDVVFGTLLSGRFQEDININNMMGMFLNTLPIRIVLKDTPIDILIKETQKYLFELIDYEQTPLVDAQRCSGLASDVALFSALFNYRQSRPSDDNLDTNDIDFMSGYERVNYPFNISIDDFGDDFAIETLVNSSINAQYISHYMLTIIDKMVNLLKNKSNKSITNISILPKQEEQQLLIEYNDTKVDYPKEKTIHQLFEAQVKLNPENVAVVYEDEELTYKQLNTKSNQLAHYLIEQGVEPDSLVAICVDRSLDMMIGLLAILKAGGAYVPIDPSYPEDRIKHMLDDSKAKLLLTQAHLKDTLPKTTSKTIAIDTLDTSKEKTTNPKTKVTSSNLVYVIYTSGSTGLPKGVMVEHRNVQRLFLSTEDIYHFNSNDIWTLFHSFSFDFAVWEMWGALLYGGKLLVVSYNISRSPELFYDVILQNNVTILNQTPSAFKQLMLFSPKNYIKGLSLKYIIFGGEKLELESLAVKYKEYKKQDITFINMYGITETTVHAAYKYITNTDIQEKASNIGIKLEDLSFYILNSHLNLVPKGVVGELHIAGDGLARGYLNQPALTKEKFIDNPFTKGTRLYKTGDLVRYLEDGNIEYIGRIDDQVKIRGFRIELGEIEQQLLNIEAIKESVVLAKEDENGNKSLVAYITTEENEEIESSSIKSTLAQHLPEYMIPVAYKTLESMPLTPNGKVDKKALAKLEVEIQSSKEYVAPRNETEEKLAKIFEEILNVEKVGIYDNFFELGGHSLLATQLVSRIRSELNIELPLKELFGTPTIEHLYHYLQSHGEESTLSKIPLVEDRDNLQLSYAQERLWFLDKFEGGNSTTYHIPAILKLEGSLSKETLNQVLTTIVKRHESLRTNFVEKNEGALQIIREVDTFALEEIRCKESSVETKIKETLTQPFNLESDSLFKAVLYTINKQTHYLLVNMHHIISDGWSIGILVQEFVALYNAYSNKQENPLQPLEIQYADYAAWQKEYLSGEVLEEKLNYWKETLGGIEPLALATTYPRPAIQSNRGNTLSFSINKEITKKLNTLSNKYDTTLFMTLLSSFGLLMHKYSGQEELIIGSPIATRNRFETEPLIGFFVNTLALKQDFSSDMKFSTVLQQTKEHTLSAYDHQDVPFEKIVDALDIPRDTSRSPLFQVMFVLQNTPENTTLELPELKIEGIAFENSTSKFDLTMDIAEVNEELHGSLEYATDLFSQTYIESMIEHFKILLEAIVKDETQAISKYPILTKQEEQQLLIEYNDTKVDYPKEKTIHQLFEAQVKLNPENVAVVYEDEELTYKQLNTKSNQLAHYLVKQGVAPDSLVAICVDRSLDMIIGLLAILKAGGAYVPIDSSYPEDRIKHMLDDSNTKLLLTQAHLKDTLPKTKSKTIAIDTLD
ncbi:MAG: amino acid adenylation domain-containing protein, partial [Sulfurovum sp.]|nr:amino acid adenylation domain-containing protein [Sulfurovum sp.]